MLGEKQLLICDKKWKITKKKYKRSKKGYKQGKNQFQYNFFTRYLQNYKCYLIRSNTI